MTSYHNIEKSAFHPGEYVGYAAGEVWRIYRETHGRRLVWIAHDQDHARLPMRGDTLRELSDRLEMREHVS